MLGIYCMWQMPSILSRALATTRSNSMTSHVRYSCTSSCDERVKGQDVSNRPLSVLGAFLWDKDTPSVKWKRLNRLRERGARRMNDICNVCDVTSTAMDLKDLNSISASNTIMYPRQWCLLSSKPGKIILHTSQQFNNNKLWLFMFPCVKTTIQSAVHKRLHTNRQLTIN